MPVDPRLQKLLDAPFAGAARQLPRPRGKTVARGYVGSPGSGPHGETCNTCEHKTRVMGGAKAFPKCALNKANWTRGPASDIRVHSPACAHWQAKA